MEIRETITKYLEETCKVSGLQPEENLFEKGVVDSLFALQLIVFIEKQYKLKIKNKDITEENFSSVNQITATIERLLGE